MRALHRLAKRIAGIETRRDPEFGIDFLHHAAPIGILAQHEFHELGASRECGQPISTVSRRAKARRINGKMFERRAPAAFRADRQQPVPPAFADQRAVGRGRDAEGIAETARQNLDLPGREIDRQQPSSRSAAHQVVRPARWRLFGRTVGRKQRTGRRGRKRIHRCHVGAGDDDVLIGIPRCRKDAHLASVERCGEPPIRQCTQRRHVAVETPHRLCCVVGEAQDIRAIGDVERATVAREIVRLFEFSRDFGVFENLVWLQCAIERRHGDRSVTAAENAVREISQRGDHDVFPQRRSYCTKFGSAFSSL